MTEREREEEEREERERERGLLTKQCHHNVQIYL